MSGRIFTITLILFFCLALACSEAKYADLADSWYPDSVDLLRPQIEKYLRNAKVRAVEGDIIGAIAPHAGLSFSGPVAAYTYKALMGQNIETVIVLGFSHKRYFPGRVSVFTDESFSTPLGKTVIDQELTNRLLEYDENIKDIPEAFDSENSIEMQLPFIQAALGNAKAVLIVICDQRQATTELVSGALSGILRDKNNFVIIASTDMAHYMDYKSAREKDMETIELIKKFDPELFRLENLKHGEGEELMCGFGAVSAMMEACRKMGALKVEILKYANSGDTEGAKDKVAGYLSAAFVRADKTGR